MSQLNYTSQLYEINGQISGLLVDYKTNYVISTMNPDNETYKDKFDNIKTQLDDIQTQLFGISNDIAHDTDTLNNELLDLNKSIETEKQTNTYLKEQLGIIEQKTHAANEMFYDYTAIYDITYLKNWAIILSIIGCLIAIKITYIPQLPIPQLPIPQLPKVIV
jgi:hypothetical protein